VRLALQGALHDSDNQKAEAEREGNAQKTGRAQKAAEGTPNAAEA
jgi:hypothetical protein